MASHIDQPEREEFERRLAASWPVREWTGSHVVVAVSGGADSVSLLRALIAIKQGAGGAGRLFVAHLNHGARGGEADADAAWVASLSSRLGVEYIGEQADVGELAAGEGDGWESAARTARYEFLLRTAERIGARFVATAHTANDQVETVLHRILRGTGIEGLAGIPRVRQLSASVVVVRPLLEFDRTDVCNYLRAVGQDFRTDSTNADRRWTRNRLRHELLPLLRSKFNAQVDDAIRRLALQAAEVHRCLAAEAAGILVDCATLAKGVVVIDCAKLGSHPAVLVREVLKLAWRRHSWPEQAMGFDDWQTLASLVRGSEARSVNFPGHVRARRKANELVLERLK